MGTKVRSDRGFSLVETMAVLLVVAVLIAIALPSLLRQREQAGDVETKQHVTSVAKAQLFVYTRDMAFTDTESVITDVLVGIDVSGDTDESVHLVVGDVVSGDSAQALVYARSTSGTWWGIRVVAIGSEAGEHRCIGDAESDMTLTACTGVAW